MSDLRTSLSSLTVVILRGILKSHHLSVSGLKDRLISRIIEHKDNIDLSGFICNTASSNTDELGELFDKNTVFECDKNIVFECDKNTLSDSNKNNSSKYNKINNKIWVDSDSDLGPKDIKTLINSILTNKSITSLKLRNIGINVGIAKAIRNVLLTNQITHLWIEHMYCKKSDRKRLLNVIGVGIDKSTNLKYLSLSHNNLNIMELCEIVPLGIDALEYLDLSENCISYSAVLLNSILKYNSNLETLDISYNHIYGCIPSIIDSIEHSNITCFDIRNNLLTNDDIIALNNIPRCRLSTMIDNKYPIKILHHAQFNV